MAGGQPPFPVPEGAGRFAGWRNRTGLSPSGGNPNVRPPVFWWLPLRSVVNTALTVAVQPCQTQAQPFVGQAETHGQRVMRIFIMAPPPVPHRGKRILGKVRRGFLGWIRSSGGASSGAGAGSSWPRCLSASVSTGGAFWAQAEDPAGARPVG